VTATQLAVAPASAAAVDPDNPWPGLESYDEASTEFFNGRQAEADDLLRRIVDEPVTILFGKSGLGKTSLLHAGVFPRLRGKDLLPITVRLQIGTGSEPLIQQVRARFLEALATEGIEHQKPRSDETLWEYLHRADQEFWTPQNRLVRPVLFFDQFEELFTLGAAVPEAVLAFREDLADLAENRVSADLAKRIDQDEGAALRLDGQAMPYKIVIALREDFLADLEGWRQTMPTLRRNRMRLLPMGAEQALQAVHNERTKHLVSEAIARRIVAFLSAGALASDSADLQSGPAVEPALLSLFCRGVNEHRKRDHKSTFDDALIEGGKGTIVVDFYRSCLADQRPRVRCFIEEDLVTEHGYRNSYAVEDAVGHKAVTASELETLINRHLLRHEQHLGIERVELTHDILTKAVVEERDARRLAEGAERERRNRWKKLRTVAIGLILLIVPLFGWLAWRALNGERLARTAERLAKSRELAAVSGQMIDRDPELALSIAAEGLNGDGTAEARGALLDAARYVWPSATLGSEELGARASIVALNADGSRLAVLAGTSLTLWDVTVRPLRPVWTEPLQLEDSTSLAFGPDQNVIVVGRAKAITVVDVATGRPSFELTSPLSEVNDRMASFSPDFRWLVWKASDSALAMVDYTEPNQVPQTIDASDVLAFAVVSGDKIVTVGHSLDNHLLSKTPAGWKREKIEVPICRENAHSVSPGARYLAATWPGVKCTYAPDGTGRPTVQQIERQMEDIIWSAGGRAYTELQGSGGLVVGRDDQPAAIIKGERSFPDRQDKTRLISVSEAGNRLAIIDEDEDHHLVKVFSLSVNKPFLSGLASDGFFAAPSGDWFAVVNRDPDTDSASADIFGIDSNFVAGHLSQPRRIEIGVAASVATSPDSLIVTGEDSSTTVYDVATGQPRYPRLTGKVELLGATRELMRLAPTRFVKTRDGSAVIPPGETKDRVEDTELTVTSDNNDAIALVRPVEGGVTAAVYSVRGDTMTRVGDIPGLPAWTPRNYHRVQVADDGRSLVLGFGDEERRFFVAGNNGQAAPPQAVDPKLIAVSRTGTYELRREPSAGAGRSNHEIGTIHLVRASADAEKSVVRHVAADDDSRYQFSSDDSLLAAWGPRGLQIVQTGSGDVLVSMKTIGIRRVEFLGGNAVVSVITHDEIMLVPIDQALMKRFAAWLNPRPVTAEERCLYGLPNAVCR
jgi:hypothetical protein